MIKAIRSGWQDARHQVDGLIHSGVAWLGEYCPRWVRSVVVRAEGDVSFAGFSATLSHQADDHMAVKNSGFAALEAADIVWETGALLLLSGGTKSRRAGFTKVSQYIREHADVWPEISLSDVEELPGWTEESRLALCSLQEGRVPELFVELRQELGDDAATLLRVRGIGLDKARAIQSSLNIFSLEDLLGAAQSGVLLQVKGIGPKSIERLTENIESAIREQEELALYCESQRNLGQGEGSFMDLLRCPATHQNGFVEEESEALLPPTGRRYPIINGVVDMVGDGHEAPSLAQSLMETRLYSQFYEGVFRPLFTRAVIQRSVTEDISLSLDMLELRPDATVLDVACGPGNFTRAIAHALDPNDGLVVGVDVSWSMLSKASQGKERSKFSNLEFVRGSATHLPFRDSSFDAVHCAAAIHIFQEPSRALQEFYRVLRPGGSLVVGTFLQSRFLPLRVAQRLQSPITGMHWFSLEELEDIVVDAGFSIQRTEINGLSIVLSGKRA